MTHIRSIFYFSLLVTLFFIANEAFTQTVTISHNGNLESSWIYHPKTTPTSYSIYNTSNYGLGQSEDEAQLFINYLSAYGGVRLNANGSSPNSFYHEYIRIFEYSEFLNAAMAYSQKNGKILKMEEYFKSKYPNNRAPKIQTGTINGNTTLYAVERKDSDNADYHFFIFINDNLGVYITAGVNYIEDKSPMAYSQYEQLLFKHIQELEFSISNEPTSAVNQPTPPEDDDGIIWEVIIGVITAAAVIGIIQRRKKLKSKKKTSKSDKKDKKEKEQADYILQLNHSTFTLQSKEPQNLVVKVWKVTEKGKQLIDANIQIQNSENALKITPPGTVGVLTSQLLLEGKPAKNTFNIKVNATAEGNSREEQVTINVGGEKQIIVELQPDKRTHRPNIKRIISCYTKVVDEMGEPMNELTEEIEFKPKSDWINASEAIMDGEWKVINIEIYDPDANAIVSHPPESVTLSWIMEKVPEDEKILQQDVEIHLLDCKIDTDVDTHELSFVAAEEETTISFSAFIEDCEGCDPWVFNGEFKTDDNQPDDALTTISQEKISDTKVEFTLTGPLLQPEKTEQYLKKKLVISASQNDEEPLERHLYVYVVKEGLYINKGLNADGAIKFLAKGDVEKEMEFSLYAYNKSTKKLEVDKDGLKLLEFELLDTSLVAQNIDKVLQTDFLFDDFVTTIPRARYYYKAPLKFPGYGDTYELNYLVSAPMIENDVKNPEAFQKKFKLVVQSYGIGDKFPAWSEAYKNCKTAIFFVPESDKRQRLRNILEKNKHKMDIEGMVFFRKKIWKIAHDLIIQERDGYLELANWHDDVINKLEWLVWCGDLAFQVVLATYVGPFAGFGISTFKEITLTGYTMAIEGKSVDEYIDAQLDSFKQMIYSATKGRAINTQTIEKYYKGNKVKVWAIYAVATFAAAYMDVKSIPEAAKITARQLRDEAIIRFLHGKVMQQKAQVKSGNSKTKSDTKNKKGTGKQITKGKGDYERANIPPDVSGYTSGSMKAIQRIANKLNIKIITRPTNAAARKLLNLGQAVAKKMFVKNKTISELDTFLGAKQSDIGKVGSFKPKFNRAKLKNLKPAQRAEVVKRYKQRRREWVNQAEHIKQYTKAKKLYVEDGVVYDKVSKKPFTGDIDIYDLRNPDGSKLTKAQYKKAVDALINSGVTNVEHGAHLMWEWQKGGNLKDININKGIYKKIAKGHSKGGEALVEFEPGTEGGVKLKSVYHKAKVD